MVRKIQKVLTALAVLWSIAMATLLLTPGSNTPRVLFFQGEDKLFHFVLFMVWSQLWVFGRYTPRGGKKAHTIGWLLAVGLSLAIGTEILQNFIPHRTMDLWDGIADISGLVAGLFLGLLAKKELWRLENKLNK